MRLLITIGHPAHVHFFKNMVWQLERDGHQVMMASFEKDVALNLLNDYAFRHKVLGKMRHGVAGLLLSQIEYEYKLYRLAKQFTPDILMGIAGVAMSHIAKLIRKPSLLFTDTEHAKLQNLLSFPFASTICTPSCFKKDLGKKQVRYNGYHELAYLHPNYFKPDPSVLDNLGLKEGDKFVIVRFVAWEASHDIGQHGFDMETKRKLINELEKYAQVFITSESPLPEEFEKYRITTPPEKIHDLLYYATMYIGEGATMATEAAILGTPSIYVSTLAFTSGNMRDLSDNYGLLYFYSDQQQAFQKALELIQQADLKQQWAKKRERLLADKIDVTQFMVDFIEGYA